MNTPGFQGFSTPRRRPLTPGRRDHVLPLFNSPASAKIARLLDSTHANPNEEQLSSDITDARPIDYDAPRVWFQREEDKRQNSEFLRRVDEMTAELKRLIRERRVEHENQVSERGEREARMTRDMEALESEHRQVLAALKDELGTEDELGSRVSQLQARLRVSQEAVVRLVERREKAEAVLAAKQKVVDGKRAVLKGQGAGNHDELVFFKEKLGLAISGGGNPDLLTFEFTQISLSEPQRPFTVTVDLSQREYRATKCKPHLDALQGHVEWLNASRDFFGFLKRVRREFVELYYNNESSS
ncbi:kinetochore-associated Ndc80 complex subunit spc25 [Coemansia sp. BCRC 34301]|nr:kinetochore-associated Ndc80 complex subunit spc25 [Coemansia sp. BCRC 34301]